MNNIINDIFNYIVSSVCYIVLVPTLLFPICITKCVFIINLYRLRQSSLHISSFFLILWQQTSIRPSLGLRLGFWLLLLENKRSFVAFHEVNYSQRWREGGRERRHRLIDWKEGGETVREGTNEWIYGYKRTTGRGAVLISPLKQF